MRMVEAPRVVLREPNNRIFSPRHLGYRTRGLHILDRPKVGLPGLLGSSRRCRAPYDHLYFPNGGFLMVVLPPGGLFPCMSIRPLSTDEFLQFSFSDEGLYLLF